MIKNGIFKISTFALMVVLLIVVSGIVVNAQQKIPYLTTRCDLDGDGFLSCNIASCAAQASSAGAVCDCDDNNAQVFPGQTEVFGDLVDNDCDGLFEEGALSGQALTLLPGNEFARYPDVANAGNGQYFVAFQHDLNTINAPFSVVEYATINTNQGSAQVIPASWSQIPNAQIFPTQLRPKVAVDSSLNNYVVWFERHCMNTFCPIASSENVNFLDVSMGVVHPLGPLASSTTSQKFPDVTSSGSLVWVVWQTNENGNWDIMAASYNPVSQTFSQIFPLANSPTDEILPSVQPSLNANNHIMVAFQKRVSAKRFEVQVLDTSVPAGSLGGIGNPITFTPPNAVSWERPRLNGLSIAFSSFDSSLLNSNIASTGYLNNFLKPSVSHLLSSTKSENVFDVSKKWLVNINSSNSGFSLKSSDPDHSDFVINFPLPSNLVPIGPPAQYNSLSVADNALVYELDIPSFFAGQGPKSDLFFFDLKPIA